MALKASVLSKFTSMPEVISSNTETLLHKILFAYNKNNLHETLNYWFRDMLNFNFSENDLGLASMPHFMYDFKKNVCHVIFY